MVIDISTATLRDFLTAQAGYAPLVYSSGKPSEVTALQERFRWKVAAVRIDALFLDTATDLLVCCETWGAGARAVCRALGEEAMRIGPEINPVVSILKLQGGSVALAMKTDSFGDEHFLPKRWR